MRKCGGCGKFVDHTISITDHPDVQDGDYCEDCTLNLTAFIKGDGLDDYDIGRYARWNERSGKWVELRRRGGGYDDGV